MKVRKAKKSKEDNEEKEDKEPKIITLDSVMKKLKKDYKSSMLDVHESGIVKRIVLDSPSLNYSFGGGFPLGRIINFFGPESGGKSTLATIIGSEIQRAIWDQQIVLYVDFERTFEIGFAQKLGLDISPEKFIFVRPDDGEEGFEIVESLVRTKKIGLVIWDSIPTTPTRAAMTDDYGKATFGGIARLLSSGLCKLNPILSKNDTSAIFIDQVRANMHVGPGPDEKATGGYAIKFYSSLRYRISKIDTILKSNETVGLNIRAANKKNKVGYPFRDAEMKLYFDRGLDTDFEYSDFLVKLGIVEKSGGWYKNEDWGMQVQGSDKIIEFLKKDPEHFKQVKNTVNEMMLVRNKVDEINQTPLEIQDTDEAFGKENIPEED
jgi:recombination protein RecA